MTSSSRQGGRNRIEARRSVLRSAAGLLLPLTLATATAAGAQLPQWRLVEDLRIGSDASETTTFADIRGVLEGAEGRIFVLDFKPQTLKVFDRTGKFVRLAARQGRGPGEILEANGMLLLRDTIWVNDPENGRWPGYSSVDGRYLRQITIPIGFSTFLWDGGTDAEGRILDPVFVYRTDPVTKRSVPERQLRRVRTDASVTDIVAAPACDQRTTPARGGFSGSNPRGGMSMGVPLQARPLRALDGRTGYWCSPNDEYLLVHRSLSGHDTLHVIRKSYERLPVSDAQRTKEIEAVKKALGAYQVISADYSLIPRVHPVFNRLDVDDRGQLWALRVVPAGAPAAFDVYDRSGRAVATVTTNLAFSGPPLHIRGDRVYGVVKDEDDVQYVVRARVVRP